MSISRLLHLGLSLLLLTPGGANAIELLNGKLAVNGFGTLGVARSTDSNAEFIRDISQQDGTAGDWDGDVDSRFGLQLRADLTETLDAMVQGVSRYDHNGSYEPKLTWAFLRYNPDPAVTLRLGRVALDSYMLADSRDVGYSYLWVRPPVDYYGTRHLSHIDGGDIVLRRPLGDGLLWGKLYAGLADEKVNSDLAGVVLDATGSRVYGGHINYEVGRWRWQLGLGEIDYRLEAPDEFLNQLDLLAFFQPRLAEGLRDAVSPTTIQMSSLGVAYDRGPLQIQAMLGQLNRSGDEIDLTTAFITAGYRLEPVTPFVSLSGARTRGFALSEFGIPSNEKAGLTQQTLSLGGRYDVARNIALKGQVDFINVDQVGLMWRHVQPDWDQDTAVFSLALDFVF
ncbi:porin [Halopseudomonas xinjiangensis]|uniref:Porin n=1 Tax=Halopseudomonas xinjiangensis TaxID=487184 RepID=A0A1H1TW02_9GAMM|nr:porin [Halopseudomonas xinjiangensis]SDS64362.1 porin [Halopseudomonas xinjiangensis]